MISAKNLYEQLHHYCPYVFNLPSHGNPFLTALQAYSPEQELSYGEYFLFAMSAHWASAGCFCPTDVDNILRFHLWKNVPDTSTLERMLEITSDALTWDYSLVTKKVIEGDDPKLRLSTHEGTWFSVAVGAYNAAKEHGLKDWELKLYSQIEQELGREEKIGLYWIKKDRLTAIKLVNLIAHNLGDFDRVIELGNVSQDDRLVRDFFQLGKRGDGVFKRMTDYYKEHLAKDNHRYFALRNLKILRLSPDFLLPIPPFLEEWGAILARTPLLSQEDKAQVIFELADGWKKLPGDTYAYPRAFCGFQMNYGRLKDLLVHLSSKNQKIVLDAEFNRRADISPQIFSQRYLKHFYL